MRIIKLSATDSTNTYLRKLSVDESINDYTCIVTEHQTKGRGQMGTIWSSEAGKNLVFSVFKDCKALKMDHTFFISVLTSLSILASLRKMNIPNLSIKWPNDILSDKKKICGILIENIIKNNKLNSSIIGIGINVNQTKFENLPNATSLKLLTGRNFNRDELLIFILNELKSNFNAFSTEKIELLKKNYESHLFRINKPSTFKDVKGQTFPGYIKGITNSGKLNVLLEDEIIQEFDLKEISLLI